MLVFAPAAAESLFRSRGSLGGLPLGPLTLTGEWRGPALMRAADEFRTAYAHLVRQGLADLSQVPVVLYPVPALPDGAIGRYEARQGPHGRIWLAGLAPDLGGTLLHELGHARWFTRLRPEERTEFTVWVARNMAPFPMLWLERTARTYRASRVQELLGALRRHPHLHPLFYRTRALLRLALGVGQEAWDTATPDVPLKEALGLLNPAIRSFRHAFYYDCCPDYVEGGTDVTEETYAEGFALYVAGQPLPAPVHRWFARHLSVVGTPLPRAA